MQNSDTGFQITAGSAGRVPQKPIASETDPNVKDKNPSSQEVDRGLQESTAFRPGSFKNQIYAKVSEKALLDKISRYFDGSPKTILIELLQNARRAGATRLDIRLLETQGITFFEFQDNGRGIQDPQILIDLAGSNWGTDTEQDEDPAGAGFFSMSTTGGKVTVRSADWSMELVKGMFLGHVGVTPRRETPMQGTSVIFQLTRQPFQSHKDLLNSLIKYGPLDVWVNGVQAVRQDFLAGRLYRKELPELGLVLGVFAESHNELGKVNFHGLVLACEDLPSLPGMCVYIDVLNTKHLKFVLPARRALQKGPELEKVKVECEIALYECVRARGAHSLSYKDYTKALGYGVDIGEAQPLLQRWVPEDAMSCLHNDIYEKPTALRRPCLIDMEFEYGKTHSLWHAWEKDKNLPNLYMADPNMVGYSWYDCLPQVESCWPIIDANPCNWSFPREYLETTGLAKALAVGVQIRNREPLILPTDILIQTVDQSSCYEPNNWIVPADHGFTKDRSELENLIAAALFSYNDNVGDFDTQASSFEEELTADITTQLEGAAENLQNRLNEFLNRWEFGGSNSIKSVTVEIDQGADEPGEPRSVLKSTVLLNED